MWLYFTDPVLRAPTIASMLMCLSAALVGVLVFLRKQSLLGEALSHAAYPGVIAGVVLVAPLLEEDSESVLVAFAGVVGAAITALLGIKVIDFLERKVKVRPDAALTFVLSAFFGVGVTLASHVQFSHTHLYTRILPYFYGQPATMTDVHIVIYGILSLAIVVTIVAFSKELQAIAFDRDFAISLRIRVKTIDTLILVLVVLAVVVGMRSVGVVLMSAMLVAPAVAARQWTNKFHVLMVLSGVIGLLAGLGGNVASVEITRFLPMNESGWHAALPTGPTIVILAGAAAVFSLLFAPQRGLLPRKIRAMKFRYRCVCENVLKAMWRLDPEGNIPQDIIAKYQDVPSLYLGFVLMRLVHQGWLKRVGRRCYRLTHEGNQWAAKIVRLHRLWERYLADYVGMGVEKVHRNAEEMEHIITPELEAELVELLHDPKSGPHHEPIPPREATL